MPAATPPALEAAFAPATETDRLLAEYIADRMADIRRRCAHNDAVGCAYSLGEIGRGITITVAGDMQADLLEGLTLARTCAIATGRTVTLLHRGSIQPVAPTANVELMALAHLGGVLQADDLAAKRPAPVGALAVAAVEGGAL